MALNSTMRCSFTVASGNAVLHVLIKSNGRRGEIYFLRQTPNCDEIPPWVPHGIRVGESQP